MNKKIIIGSIVGIAILTIIGIAFILLNNSTVSDAEIDIGKPLFNPSIENEKLTKENYEKLINEYGEKHKDSDNAVYLSYALANYMFKDGMSAAFDMNKTEEEKKQESYKNIYGKTIRTLVDEGKELMKENNVTVEEYKKSLENFSNSIDDLNKSINNINN